MNLKKRLTAALLSAALALSLVACGSPATQESPSTAPSPSAEPASAGHTAADMIVLAGARTLAPGGCLFLPQAPGCMGTADLRG